ncbi:hypothetical protein MKX01_038489 [Papaver californicum]|nr:hypothetical protein MKX01_038489 [Papaver californicum]
MVLAIIAGASVAAASLGGRYLIRILQAYKAHPVVPRMRRFYEERDAMEKIREAHSRVMVANHPDHGGNAYLATKINEAKDMLSGKHRIKGLHFKLQLKIC